MAWSKVEEQSWKGEMKTHPLIARAVVRLRKLPAALRSAVVILVCCVVPAVLFALGRSLGESRAAAAGAGSAALDKEWEQYRNFALITIATAGYDASYLVHSARTTGQWRGRIFVVTDGSSPVPDDCYAIRVPVPEDSLYAVAYKTQLLDLVSPKQFLGIDRLVYLDCDMALNAPVVHFLKAFGSWDHRSGCSIYMVRERWYTKSDWNSGTVVMDREFSAAMLQKWEDMITENHDLILAQNTYSKDQWALMQLVEDYKVCALPEGQVTFVADLWGRLTTVLTSLGLGRPATFVHYTSAKNDASAPHFKTKMSREELKEAAAADETSVVGGGRGSRSRLSRSRALLEDPDEGLVAAAVEAGPLRGVGAGVRGGAVPRGLGPTTHLAHGSSSSRLGRMRRGGIRAPQHLRQARLPGADVAALTKEIDHSRREGQR